MSEKKRIIENWWVPCQKKLVEDESIVWKRKIFKNADGYWIKVTEGKLLTKISDKKELPPGAIVEKNAWNHEHCSLCWKIISEELNDAHEGYTEGNDWLCEECYKKYIV